jgi:sugar lactone lactonase YvrE
MRAWVAIIGLAACSSDPCAKPGAMCTVAGVAGVSGFNGDGLAIESWMYFPSALQWSPEGVLIINDFNNMRVRALSAEGELRTIVGSGFHAYATPQAPVLESPLENAVDISYTPDGALLIAELHGARVLRVDEDAVIEEVAGRVGDIGFTGDGGPALSARMSQLSGVDAGPDGTIWISDTENHCIRRVVDGVIDRVAGDGLAGADDGLAARFRLPQRMAVGDGFVLVADAGNNRVRRVDVETGEVTTVAGTGEAAFSGDGGPATAAAITTPYGVALDPDGGFWIADSGNHRIRHVDAAGVIQTVAGDGREGFSEDEVPATESALAFPADVLADGDGGYYIADMLNSLVRHVAGPSEGR